MMTGLVLLVLNASFLAQAPGPVPHYVRMLADLAPVSTGQGLGESKNQGIKCFPSNPGVLHAPSLGIDSFAAPDTSPYGLEWISGKLWDCDIWGQTIYQLDPANGSVLRTIPAPDAWSKDLAFDGNYLFVCGNNQSRIYKVDTATGSQVGSFQAPGDNPVGLCFGDGFLWNADWNSDQSKPNFIFKLNASSGQKLDSILTPAEWPAGLAWDDGSLWNADMKNGIIYRLDPATGAVSGATGTPGSEPTGLAFDGTELWNADNARDMIYHFRSDSGPAAVLLNAPHDFDALPCWHDVAILGTVAGGDLQQFQVEYGAGADPSVWYPVGSAQSLPVYLDTLATWDVSGFDTAGIYRMRINAVFASHVDTVRSVEISLDPQIMEGWPQTFANVSPLALGDVNSDLEAEVFAGLNHQDYFHQRLGGWNLDGSFLAGFPAAGINNCQMAPALGDVRHNDSFCVAAGFDLNHDQVNIVRSNGAMLPGWPQTGGHPGSLSYLGLPVLADLNRDSLLEVFAGGSTFSGWSSSGAPLPGWPKPFQASSPAVGDLNRDGWLEAVVLSGDSIIAYQHDGSVLAGFPRVYSGASNEQYPVLGDINHDGRLEIVFDIGARLYATDDTGHVLTGFPKTLSGNYANSPILADLDRDGQLEIVTASGSFPSYTEIAVHRSDGSVPGGWPVRLNNRAIFSFNEPIAGDINNDSLPEIIMGFENVNTTFEELHAWTVSGTELGGWPRLLRYIDGYGISGSPVLGDFNSDSLLELAVSSSAYWMANTDIYLWSLDQPVTTLDWPTQRHDNRRTACVPTGLAGVAERRKTPEQANVCSPRPVATVVRNALWLAPATGHKARTSDCLLDISGREVMQLVTGPNDVSGLCAGVYFVARRQADGGKRPEVAKVVIER
jgi:glutamine cyclotransferase